MTEIKEEKVDRIEIPVYYSITMNDGMKQFGKSNSKQIRGMATNLFVEMKLQDFPFGREVQFYSNEEDYKNAQKIIKE